MLLDIETVHLRVALLFAAKNDIRYYLNCVHFVAIGGFLVIQATDGERLIRITTATPLPTPLNALVPLDAVKSIVKSKAAFESLEFTDKTVKAQRQTWELIEGQYPAVCDILPPNWEAPAVSGYHNPWFVADAWQAV